MSIENEAAALARIAQLERLNSQLATQIDRMRPVVDAARDWCRYEDAGRRVYEVIYAYDAVMAALEKGA